MLATLLEPQAGKTMFEINRKQEIKLKSGTATAELSDLKLLRQVEQLKQL